MVKLNKKQLYFADISIYNLGGLNRVFIAIDDENKTEDDIRAEICEYFTECFINEPFFGGVIIHKLEKESKEILVIE
jgi:hypothetical protein